MAIPLLISHKDRIRLATKKINIEPSIITVRGQKVILDSDLAGLYGVPTKRLNEQVRRNADRFSPDFAFQLVPQDVADLKSQPVTASLQPIDNKADNHSRSQFATFGRP